MTFKERAEQLAKNCRRVKGNGVYETLAKEFGISKRNAGDRFKSLFGVPVRDYISNNIIPTDEQIIDYLVQSSNVDEFWKLTDTNEFSRITPILNRLFGTTNYRQIKVRLQAKQRIKDYKVTLADNKAFLISQYLGDGSLERGNAFRIEHGHKQYSWLKFKVGMFNTMYPLTNGLENITLNNRIKTGYKSYVYRTGPHLKKQVTYLVSKGKINLVPELTPLGVMIYFMDDGYLSYNSEFRTTELGFATVNPELRDALVDYFKTYGYEFNKSSKAVTLQKRLEVIKFIQEFILPFSNIIPKEMSYKYNLEDIVGDV